MKISTRKNLWWSLLAVGVGGMFLIASLGIIREFAFLNWRHYLWFLASLALSGIGSARLRFWYRREPYSGPGLWQLSLLDLLSASFFTGLTLAFWGLVVSDSDFLMVGIPASLLTSTTFVWGLLVGTRSGLSKTRLKVFFATSYVLRLFGALSVGGLISIMLAMLFFGENPFRLMGEVLGTRKYLENYWLHVFRSGLVCLPLGLIGCHYAIKAPTNIGK